MRVDILSDSNCCPEPVYCAAIEENGTSGLNIEVLMTWLRIVLMLYFFMVAHEAACQDMVEVFLVLEIFLT